LEEGNQHGFGRKICGGGLSHHFQFQSKVECGEGHFPFLVVLGEKPCQKEDLWCSEHFEFQRQVEPGGEEERKTTILIPLPIPIAGLGFSSSTTRRTIKVNSS